MTEILATSSHETPVFCPVGKDRIFGIFTAPVVEPVGTAVVFLAGGGQLPSPHRNRFAVRLSRRLASEGYHGMRFDYRGVGESTGSPRVDRLDEPSVADLEGVAQWIQTQGVTRLVLVGSCFGARTALAWAARKPAVVQGLVLLSVPLRDVSPGAIAEVRSGEYANQFLQMQALRRLASISPHFMEPLEALVKRRVPMLFIYGSSENYYQEFNWARSGYLGTILNRAGSLVTVKELPDRVHSLPRVSIQDAVIESISGWLPRQAAKTTPA
jgi:pimeloyl-ACP methyl ester carboxylesterase